MVVGALALKILKMKTFLIGYDLNKAGQDYSDLIDAIKKESVYWWHHLDSTWLIVTNDSKTAVSIRDTLKTHIDGNDELLVVEVTGDPRAWAGFSDKGSAWLKDTYV